MTGSSSAVNTADNTSHLPSTPESDGSYDDDSLVLTPAIMRPANRYLAAADRGFSLFIQAIVALALVAELVVMFGNIIARTFFNAPWIWSAEVGSDALSVVTFLGAAIACQRGQLIAVEALIDRLPLLYRQIALATGDWIVVSSGVFIIVLSRSFLEIGQTATAPTLSISAFWTELPLPVGVTLFVLNVLRCRLVRYPLKIVGATAVFVGALTAVFYLLEHSTSLTLSTGMALLVILIAFAITVAIGTPIMFGFLVAAMLFLALSRTVGADSLPPKIWNAPRDPLLLAVPFFTWVGFIMTRGGLSGYLARLTSKAVDHVRGGVLHVVVLVMYVFSGISGSKTADMAAVSATLRDAAGDTLDDGRFTAVLNASAVMAETVPPSIGLIVAGSITSLSVITLFLAGLLPALALAICMMIVIYVQARLRHEPRRQHAPYKEVAKAFVLAVPTLTVPLVIIVGVVKGYSTPTEVSSVAVVYALVLAIILYRKMTWRIMWGLTIETVSIAGMALFALSTASAFSFTLTIAEVPDDLGNWITSLHVGGPVFLLLCALFMILMGAVFEGLPALLIFVPLFFLPAQDLGVNPIHFVIVMLVAIHIGTHAPPLGVGFYIACLLTKTKPAVVMRQNWIYLGVLVAGLMLLIFVPGTSLWLPHALGHH
jgi:tripartite ATP-independent transporter DctM subunit